MQVNYCFDLVSSEVGVVMHTIFYLDLFAHGAAKN